MKNLVIANWKMNLTPKQSVDLALQMENSLGGEKTEIVLCPSFSALSNVSEVINKPNIFLGAQNIFWDERGAFTGEESIRSIKELGCKFSIIGHSERRKYFNETDNQLQRKISLCIDNGIVPVLCIGETAEQKQQGLTENILWNQLTQALDKIELMPKEEIAIAYEPIWAIGTGLSLDVNDAKKHFDLIYQKVTDLWPLTIAANNVRILYGGSVDSVSALDLYKTGKIKGFLVGGASLSCEEFTNIVKNIQ